MCFSESDPEPRKQSRWIDKKLEEDKQKQKNHVKLLLLGAGESGKSTIAKQMKIIHLNGYTEEELAAYKKIIWGNVVGSMRVLVEAAEHFGYSLQDTDTARKVLAEDYFTGEFSVSMAGELKKLWKEESIQSCFQRASETQLNDSAEYYFNALDRLSAPDYRPSVQDVLRSRAKTTGINETEFKVGKTRFTLVDVGGQRSERRKWMHCFQDVTAVIFCVAMSAYDQKLYEDETTNRMHEALKLFKDICNTKWFADTAIILFLNKKDLFEKKIKKVPLTKCFREYTGPNTYEAASQYIEEQFLGQNEKPTKLIYPHKTCATDTDNITVVFKAVQDIILNKILDSIGI